MRPGDNGCQVFTSTIKPDGYGRFWFRGRQEQAHRAAYTLFCGPIPAGMHVCHRCDNRVCVNTEHLFLGSALDNNRDRSAKGRTSRHARVTSDAEFQQVKALREQGWSQQAIGDRLGMTQSRVSRMLLGKPLYSRQA